MHDFHRKADMFLEVERGSFRNDFTIQSTTHEAKKLSYRSGFKY
jgi:hypothetical protein